MAARRGRCEPPTLSTAEPTPGFERKFKVLDPGRPTRLALAPVPSAEELNGLAAPRANAAAGCSAETKTPVSAIAVRSSGKSLSVVAWLPSARVIRGRWRTPQSEQAVEPVGPWAGGDDQHHQRCGPHQQGSSVF